MINKDGVKSDLTKEQALKKCRRPIARDELISFLYMIRSNGTLILGLAATKANLYELMKQKFISEWT